MTESLINTHLLHEKAGQLLQLHRLTEARPLYVEICETTPDDADAWLMLGAIDEQLGLLDDAVEYLHNAIAHVPEMAEAYLTLANILWRKGQIEQAIEVMLKACNYAPDYAEAWHRLGRMQLEAGDSDAINSFIRAGSLDPENTDLAQDKVEALIASEHFDAALVLCPSLKDDQSDYWLGRVYFSRGETASAIHAFTRVSATSPWHISANWMAAQLAGSNVRPDLLRDYVQWIFDYLASVYDYHCDNTAVTERNDVLKEVLHEHLPVNANLLDLGCGTGRVGRLLRRKGDYLVGIDLSRAMLDRAAQQGGYDVLIHADLRETRDRGKDVFDLVILANVLQWCIDPDDTLEAASQAVTGNGLLIVSQEADAFDRDNSLYGISRIEKSLDVLIGSESFDLLHAPPVVGSANRFWLLRKTGEALSGRADILDKSIERTSGLTHLHEGMGALARKDYDLAQEQFELALTANPLSTDTLLQMGLLSQEQEKYDKALDYYRSIIEIEPDNVVALFQIGTVYQGREELSEAIKVYRQATEQGAKLWMLYNNLGWVLQQQGETEPARRAFLTALYHDPVNRMALGNLQVLEDKASGQQPRAQTELSLEDAAGDDAGMLLGFGIAMREREFYQRALVLIKKAMEMQADFHDASLQLALTLQKMGDVAGAIVMFNDLLEKHPNKASVYDNLAGAIAACDDIEKACLMWEKGSQQSDISAGTHSNRLFMYNYSPQAGREILSRVHIEWGKILEQATGPVLDEYKNKCDANRRLRIGYVSADFYGHSVSHFLEPVMASHDHENFEIFCYANNEKEDQMTLRHRYYADHWRRINGQDDATVVQRIRDDGIDILVDLTGHTGGSRMAVLAQKPAPVQATWLGYPNTTGLSRIDYRLTDAWADPPGMTESLHSEKLFRLPDGFLCYQPTEFAPAIEVSRGHRSTFTFGCFNNLYKLSPDVVRVWSRILKAMPESTLLLKSFGFNADCVYERYTRLFTEQGIDPQRIHMMGRLGTREHLDLYNKMDVVLDPFPYNGTTTTCEALWMGVPVIALAGDRHAARVSVSLLSVMSCEELIAKDEDEYVQKAIDLAKDHDRLVNYKVNLRRTMKDSPLTDRVGFTHQLELSYRQMWKVWCKPEL